MNTYKNILQWVIPVGLIMWLVFYVYGCNKKMNIPPKVGTEYHVYGCNTCLDFQIYNENNVYNPFFSTRIKVTEIRRDYIKYQCVYTNTYYTLPIFDFNSRLNTYGYEN